MKNPTSARRSAPTRWPLVQWTAATLSLAFFLAPSANADVAWVEEASGAQQLVQGVFPENNSLVPRNAKVFMVSFSELGFIEMGLCDAELEGCDLQNVDDLKAYPCSTNGLCVSVIDPGELEANNDYQLHLNASSENRSSVFSTAGFNDDTPPMIPTIQNASVESNGERGVNLLIIDLDSSTLSTDAQAVLFYETQNEETRLHHADIIWAGSSTSPVWAEYPAEDTVVERCISIAVVDIAGLEGEKSEAVCLQFPARQVDLFSGCGFGNEPTRGSAPLSALGILGLGWGLRRRRRRLPKT